MNPWPVASPAKPLAVIQIVSVKVAEIERAIAKALDGRLNLRPHPLSDPVKQRLVELDSDAVIVEANPVFFTAERPGNALLDHLPVYDGPVIDKARQHVVGGKLGLVGDVAHADHVRLGAGSEHRDADAVAA